MEFPHYNNDYEGGIFVGDASDLFYVSESQHRSVRNFCQYIFFLAVDNHHFCDIYLHDAFWGDIFPGCSSSYGDYVGVFTFVCLLTSSTCTGFRGFLGRFTYRCFLFLLLASLDIFRQHVPLDYSVNGILQLDEVIGVVVVTLVKARVF